MIGASAPLALTAHLAWVSSISFGGFPTVLPDVRTFVVDKNGWMTNQEFANLFAMAQSIPGPNSILLLVGIRFQELFHSPRRGAFYLSLTVLVHYRSRAAAG
jgi:chromate transport protein ChrA